MKPLILFFAAVLFLSCTAVQFEQPQPTDLAALNEFPENIWGTYISEDTDTLIVSRFEFHFLGDREIEFSHDLNSPESVLKKDGDHFILNLKNNDNWDVFPFRFEDDKLLVYYSCPTEEVEDLIADYRQTASVKEVPDTYGNIDFYLLDPTPAQFRDLFQKNIFSDHLIFTRVKEE
ncbi:hypothetical protein [Salinimicrobium flavum]|uniref:Lipoprotein n=1 Tax=Salinimicrobium flavum TaxID=1737065 RepID=A0ABW5J1D7_9FLAO